MVRAFELAPIFVSDSYSESTLKHDQSCKSCPLRTFACLGALLLNKLV